MEKQEQKGRLTDPKSIEDYQHNVQFQLDNVEGWVYVKNYESALIKAEYLVKELKSLIEFTTNQNIKKNE